MNIITLPITILHLYTSIVDLETLLCVGGNCRIFSVGHGCVLYAVSRRGIFHQFFSHLTRRFLLFTRFRGCFILGRHFLFSLGTFSAYLYGSFFFNRYRHSVHSSYILIYNLFARHRNVPAEVRFIPAGALLLA
jgi:hypothetical protein